MNRDPTKIKRSNQFKWNKHTDNQVNSAHFAVHLHFSKAPTSTSAASGGAASGGAASAGGATAMAALADNQPWSVPLSRWNWR